MRTFISSRMSPHALVARYGAWRKQQDPSITFHHDDFYDDEVIRGWYRNYVTALVTRVNVSGHPMWSQRTREYTTCCGRAPPFPERCLCHADADGRALQRRPHRVCVAAGKRAEVWRVAW